MELRQCRACNKKIPIQMAFLKRLWDGGASLLTYFSSNTTDVSSDVENNHITDLTIVEKTRKVLPCAVAKIRDRYCEQIKAIDER